jgi:hypothetical protein
VPSVGDAARQDQVSKAAGADSVFKQKRINKRLPKKVRVEKQKQVRW